MVKQARQLVLGFDAGNDGTMVAIRGPGGRPNVLTFPSVVGAASQGQLDRLLSMGGGKLADEDMAIVYRGQPYFVGSLAMRQVPLAGTGVGDDARYTNGHTLLLLLAALGQLGKSDVCVRLITGVPVGLYRRDPDIRRKVQRALIGTHEYRYRGEARTVTVEAVGVLMEGAGVLRDLADKRQHAGVIDIGGGTVNLYWANGPEPIKDRCQSKLLGTERIGAVLNELLQDDPNGRQLTREEVREVLWAQAQGKPLPALYVAGKPLVLNGHLKRAIETAGEPILTFVAQTWRDEEGTVGRQAAVVRLIGGGAYYYADAVKEVVPHAQVMPQPEQQNAVSYLAVGAAATEEQWARNRGQS